MSNKLLQNRLPAKPETEDKYSKKRLKQKKFADLEKDIILVITRAREKTM